MSDLTRRTFVIGTSAVAALAVAGCTPATRQPHITGAVPRSPIAFARTSWSRDPFTLGSYSFLAPSELGTDAREALAAPVGRLFFAGEATSSEAPATAHGAATSGLRAAGEAAEVSDTVVVIGAGLAGLAAARTLVDEGVNVIIVEARDRVGGRAHTIELAGTTADLGPSWVHGVTNNVVAEFANETGIELVPFDYDNAVGGDDAALAQIDELFEAALDEDDAESRPLSDLLPDALTPGQSWAVTVEIPLEFGADPDELSMAALGEGDELAGGDALVAGGYGSLAQELASGLAIELNWIVATIEHGGDGVTVRSTDGRTIRADSAIVTLPLGVLQAGAVAFTPALPDATTGAIDALGMGLLDKLWLTFDEVFWDPAAEVIRWIDPEDPGLWGFWVNGYAAFGTPSLLTFVGGSRARAMAEWTDDEVVTSAMSALRRMG